MGLMEWLKKDKRVWAEPDSVWPTDASRLAGLCQRAVRHAQSGQVLVLAHFPATLQAVAAALLAETGVDRARSEGEVAGHLASPETGSICLALVSQLPTGGAELYGHAAGQVSFLVAERHPLRTRDERVEQCAAGLPHTTSVRFHLSLEDPLLARFAGDQVMAMLRQLGMAEDEELSHPMIAGAVERAQGQLARQEATEVEADSVEDWLQAVEPR